MSGCLVTDKIDLTENNVPPVILDVPQSRAAIGDIIYFDASKPATIKFEFRVRDENIGQLLKARSRIYLQEAEYFTGLEDTRSVDIIPSGEPIRDSAYFEWSEGSFSIIDRCYRVDLAVTSEFKYDSDHQRDWGIPTDKEDIGRARWYVVTGDETSCRWVTEYE